MANAVGELQEAKPGPVKESRPRMTPYEKWSLVVQVVGFLLVSVSLLAAWLQLRFLTEQNRMLVHTEREASTLGLDRVFVEYPEIRPYFYGEADIEKTDPLYRRVEAVAEMHLDVFDYKLKHAETFKTYQPFEGVEREWIRDMFRTSPVLRRYVDKHWYSDELRGLRDEALKKP
jgi:hypothetical protein